MSMAQKARLVPVVVTDRCPVDPIIAGAALLLLLLGIIMVGSASDRKSVV